MIGRTTARWREARGSALVLVVLMTGVLAAAGAMLALVADGEVTVATEMQHGHHTMALAEAALELAIVELAAAASWDAVLSGARTSVFHDGGAGQRRVGGLVVDLEQESARLLCGRSSCIGHPPDELSADRPWGRNNPRWRIFAAAGAQQLLAAPVAVPPGYVVVWVGDDPGENDGDPQRDGGPPSIESGAMSNPGTDVLALRIVAWGSRETRREMEALVERADTTMHTGARLRVWRERRGADH